MMPQRIQRLRVKGWRKPPGTLNATRPSRHSNPFSMIGGEMGREDSIFRFRLHLDIMQRNEPEKYNALLDEVRAAKNIMCFCPLDKPCHVDEWIGRAKP